MGVGIKCQGRVVIMNLPKYGGPSNPADQDLPGRGGGIIEGSL